MGVNAVKILKLPGVASSGFDLRKRAGKGDSKFGFKIGLAQKAGMCLS